jgi:Ca-activated chloride channel family protein
MRFATPDNAWLLLLIPVLALFALWATRQRQRDLQRFVGPEVSGRLTRTVRRSRQQLKSIIIVVGILLLVIALTGPQFGVRLEMAERRGVDVVVVLDLSRSMLAEDVRPNRLARARHAIGELLDGLQGDRAGFVVFAANAFVQCPLTLDLGAMRMLLTSLDAGDIPSQGTSLARALETAGKSFDADDRQYKVVVVFSDGEAHVGDASSAAAALAAQGARVYCVGMGTTEGDLIPLRADDGTRLEYHKDREGNYVKSRLDETALRAVAAAGEGAYWRSTLGGRELQDLVDRIADLEDKELGAERFTRYEERFQLPLLVALICFLLEALLSERARVRREWQGRFA